MAAPFTLYKLIILYMLEHAGDALTNSQISEFILDREYTGYFHLQQAISELTEAELVEKQTIGNTSYYRLAPDGKETLGFFEKELSSEIKEEVQIYLKEKGYEIQSQILTPADYYATRQGGFAVRCQIIEKNVALVDLNMTAPSKEAAKAICRSWPDKCQEIYAKIMEELL